MHTLHNGCNNIKAGVSMPNQSNLFSWLLPCLLTVMIMLVQSTPALAEDKPASYLIGLGIDYFTGTYGTSTRADTIITPLTIAVNPNDRLGFLVSIPFVYQDNGGALTQLSQGSTGTTSAGWKRPTILSITTGIIRLWDDGKFMDWICLIRSWKRSII